ncbi:sodium:solute symporter family protein [Candidatus Cardinium hertigii]|uniref:Bifunctional (P)ppGpp synthase/hydrolase SpoT n=1 Tax=Candidatus Cardinium hertigii TaxID=247481 RepID=A0A2Z3L833_9BACT|nr:sodium:solute symporter family protein [Candidatus Cardinium hertigii]AWN81589.1 Bifunctional (p)ppGpp synthase/hydrolase SpoT [Candidatus Cardinium hertigii]
MIQIDLLIIGLFLLVTLIIGLYYGRGIKTFQDYAVGNRKVSTMVITLSMIATIYDGGILHSRLEAYYRQGVYALLLDLSSALNLYLASRFIISRMKEFIGHASIAESMGSLYGPIVRMVSGLLGIMMAIAILAAQVKIALNITQKLLPGIHTWPIHSTIVWVSLVILYASFGGARSVAITDVYQFLLFGLCFPLLIFICLFYTNPETLGWQKLIDIPSFNIRKVFTWNDTLANVLACFILRSMIIFDPARIQRFYMSFSITQAIKVFNQTAISRIIIPLLFLSVAIALHVGNYNIESGYNVLYYIIDFAHFPGVKGIFITVIFALLMSTADSNLHAASVLFANDVGPFLSKRTKHLGKQPSIKVVRVASILIGLISLVVALHTTHVMHLLIDAAHIYGTTVAIPFIMACLGFRPRLMVVLCSICINAAIAITYICYNSAQGSILTNLNPFEAIVLEGQKAFVFLMVSACILLALHYLLPKLPGTGWIGIPDSSAWDLQNQITKRWWLTRMQRFKMFCTRSYRISVFPTQERTFVAVGCYTIINAIIALCFIQRQYFLPYVYLYMAVMALGTILALYPALHAYQKGGTPLLHNLWPMLLFLLLFIAPLQFAKLGHYSPMVCALWVSNLGLGIVLLSLETSSILLAVALGIHQAIPPYTTCLALASWGLSIELVLASMLITAAIIGLGIYKYLRDKATAKLNIIELTRTYEQRISLEAIYSQAHWARLDATAGGTLLREMGHALQEISEVLYKQNPTGLRNEIVSFNKKLQKFSDCLAWRAQEERSLKLNKKSIQPTPLESTILIVNQQILDLGEPLALLLRKQTDVAEIAVDPALLECLLLLNLWAISKSQQATDHIVTLTLAATTLQYGLATETAADLPSLTLPALAFRFSTDTSLPNLKPSYRITAMNANSTLPASEAQFYQLESKQIVEAHGGYVEIIESPTQVNCLYVFPLDGRKVMRFKTYDPADLVANKIAETAESLAQEQELIGLLTAQTTLKEELIQQTIAFIKKAHGLVRRKSGSPYYTHPMAVAKLLLEATQDPDTILVGLLHDIVEDTPVTLSQLELMYGSEVAAVVDQVTHYNTNGYPWKLDKVANKNILHQCRDIRVVQVKLADRLHNMRTLFARKPSDQQRIAQETLTFYIPWGKNHKAPQQWLAEMQRICEGIIAS